MTTLDIGNMCSSQLLDSNIHNNFKEAKKYYQNICNPPYFYLSTRENFAPPYTSPNLVQIY